jgi:hypothetical protein
MANTDMRIHDKTNACNLRYTDTYGPQIHKRVHAKEEGASSIARLHKVYTLEKDVASASLAAVLADGGAVGRQQDGFRS